MDNVQPEQANEIIFFLFRLAYNYLVQQMIGMSALFEENGINYAAARLSGSAVIMKLIA